MQLLSKLNGNIAEASVPSTAQAILLAELGSEMTRGTTKYELLTYSGSFKELVRNTVTTYGTPKPR